jgi:HlyD family secretion protein
MPKKISKRMLKWIIAGVVVAVLAFVGIKFWTAKKNAVPEGIASGNGRLEGKLVDVAAKEPLKVKEVLVEEGALVKPGQLLARLDTITLDAELAQANASVAAAQERMALAKAAIVKEQRLIGLAKTEEKRSRNLVDQNAGSQRELDVRTTTVGTTQASLAQAEAALQTAMKEVKVAEASAATIQTRIDDATLKSPVNGRVLYRLAEPGEVLAAGGKAVTLVDLEDIYMEIFLPSGQAGRLKVGAEGRLSFDFLRDTVIPGYVSFVSPEAQFTPKQVETKSEREKLMFRVKIQVPKELVTQYIERIKTGVRGVGYVKYDDSAVWPDRLNKLVTPRPEAQLLK